MDPRGMVGGTCLHKIPLFNTTDVTRFENVKCVVTQVRFDAKFFVLFSRSWKFFLFFKFPSLGECEIPPPCVSCAFQKRPKKDWSELCDNLFASKKLKID